MATPRPSRKREERGNAPRTRSELKGPEVGSLLDNLKRSLKELDREVKQEETSREELGRELQKLQRQRDELRKDRDRVAEEAQRLENHAAGFQQEFSNYLDNTHETYQYVSGRHRTAISILSKDDTFKYHPAFKRSDDQFSGNYFTPRAIKKSEDARDMSAKRADQLAERLKKKGTLQPQAVTARAGASMVTPGSGSGAGAGAAAS
mmetsp:Transcript_44841/g.100745  ORF Transcript_44841/g.100745 Transcript_44841/m.100745 type:complete len:206 (-) Transcript_44841:97-714(-)